MIQRHSDSRRLTRNELNSLVDKAADLIRTAVDYKFILVLLFLKRLNDIRARESKQRKPADEETQKVARKIPENLLWGAITQDGRTLPGKLANAMGEIAKLIPALQGVIDKIDFLEFARNQENQRLLTRLIDLFNKYDLGSEKITADILGDAYEHILLKFAPERAKEGEIYTPRKVIQLIVELLDPKPGESVYDPCCGSGGMLIVSYRYVMQKFGKPEAEKLSLYGQERNREIYAVSAMNLLFHEIKNARLQSGDTLEYPRFKEDGRLQTFRVVLGNVPWNQDGYDQERLQNADFPERFKFGFTPSTSADWAWIEHAIASTHERGRIGLVVDNGCLFRTGQEK